jgi:hypothetical protein
VRVRAGGEALIVDLGSEVAGVDVDGHVPCVSVGGVTGSDFLCQEL